PLFQYFRALMLYVLTSWADTWRVNRSRDSHTCNPDSGNLRAAQRDFGTTRTGHGRNHRVVPEGDAPGDSQHRRCEVSGGLCGLLRHDTVSEGFELCVPGESGNVCDVAGG